MKEIIPLNKDIIFKTKIGEITNIGLDYDYKINDDLIEGSVDISGSYKMLQTSVIEEDFFYSIPFSVALSNNIVKDSIKIEVDDFKYKFDKDVLNISIDLSLECDREENTIIENNIEEENINKYFNNINLDLDKDESINIINEENTNITNNMFNLENKYYTYRVYIVKPNDTLETISNKYKLSVDDIKINNPQLNINNIQIGDKIIIPEYEE